MDYSTLRRSSSESVQSQGPESPIEVQPQTEFRYPKRKRESVKYAESGGDELELDEDNYTSSPKRSKKRRVSKSLPKQKIFPFLSLPAELRNKIYGFVFATEEGIFITSKTRSYRRQAQRCIESECRPQFQANGLRWYQNSNNNINRTPTVRNRSFFYSNLLTVSRTVYAEAGSFLYGQRIVVADNYALLSFLNQIGLQHVKLLRTVVIKDWCGSQAHRSINFPAMVLLSSATNLECLLIASPISYVNLGAWRDPNPHPAANRIARRVFRDCYPVLETIGRSKGGVDAGVDVIMLVERNFDGWGWTVEETGMSEDQRRVIDRNIELYRAELRRLLRS